MASFFERLMGRREPSSAASARERLQLVLVTDRSDLSPEKLEQMQAEIIQVIRSYLQIEVADIPLVRDHVPKAAEALAESPPEEVPDEAPAASDTKPKRSSRSSRPRSS